MRVELKLLQRQLGLASIYVTHDQAEAMVLADHLVVMRDGVIAQQGPAEALFRRPRSAFVARFFGVTNLLAGRLIELGSNGARVDVGSLGTVSAFAADEVRGELKSGDAVCVSIRPLELTMSPWRTDAVNAFQGKITERIFLGDLTEYFVLSGDVRLRVHAPSSTRFAPDDIVWIGFGPEAGTVVLNS
jgi:ABC-type Fe3+/spermidine/putrescine transport system ATPase subunit